MKKIFFFSACLLSTFLPAKIYLGDAADVQQPGADKVIIDDQRKTLSFVHYRPDAQPAAVDLAQYLRKLTVCKAQTGFVLYKTETDKQGWIHYRFHQAYNNVVVEDAVFYIHTLNGKIISANGEYYLVGNVNTSAGITQAQAEQTAAAALHATEFQKNYPLSPSEQVIYKDASGIYHYAWKADAWSLVPQKRYWYFIDIHSGKICGEKTRMCDSDVNGVALTAHNGLQTLVVDSLNATSYRLKETGRGGGIYTHAPGPTEIMDNDNYWTNTANYDNYATDAHFSAEMTYDFYYNTFGRNSIDNANMLIDIQAHDGMYVNAFWNGTYAAFGDGDAAQYYPLTSLEIVGHEITHGVTQFSAGLNYAGESGALNESFSDIAGNTIRFLSNPSVATWLIGDQIVIPSQGGTPFRSMADPNLYQCADCYNGLYFNNGDIVHYDSGIQNYWYYLLVNGGSGTNDIGNNFNVTGIGMTDAMAITYRNLTVYLTPNSTFADAATYAEQSAIDLFGQCSPQQIATANAWYAVGVGNPFSGIVTADFMTVPSVSCSSPATISFINTGWNGTAWQWNFGDAGTSTLQSPSHTYLSPGVYNVTLIATGSGNCVGSDTITINAAVTVNNVPGPVPASCSPPTQSYCCGFGITNVQFNTINWTSNDAIDNYSDFTCADSTLLIAGDPYAISVTTNSTSANDEHISVFIDYNNDGIFNNTTELVYSDNGSTGGLHSGTINTLSTTTLNTRLRMRVISDDANNAITGGCYSPVKGQVEDYMVYFVPNTLPPDVNFTANVTTIPVGSTVNFQDLTIHAPTSWSWTFTGGAPATSTVQNPQTILYNTAGLYPVKLVAANSFGSDSLTQIQYINVVNTANICQTTTMNSLSGTLYDSGGPTGDYVDNESCSFLINPGCASSLTMTFNAFDIEYSYDYLTVYNGTNASAPLLGSFTGNTLPPTLTATSGAFFITFTSDFSVTYSGWDLTWTGVPSGNSPTPAFSYSPASPLAQTPVQFTDQTLNSPTSWSWDFGDLGTSTLQNPSHVYAAQGTYTVTLIVSNCVGSDTTTNVVDILPNGVEEYSAGSFEVYPVPFTENATLVLGNNINPASVSIEITDLSGRKITEIKPQSSIVTIHRGGMSAGIYFVNLYRDGVLTGTRKIVIE